MMIKREMKFHMTQTTNTAHGETPDPLVDQKLCLLMDTYKEVLDATKHQDDKIGRLLTSAAFLTAATLALASLNSAEFGDKNFDAPPFTLPLGLISLAIFLVGVVFSVVLLVTGLSAPLRIPWLSQPTDHRDRVTWINDLECSHLYFLSIGGVASEEWHDKWRAGVPELKQERQDALVHETHNLAVRTIFKYDRSSEAVSLLSLSLLAFSLAVMFVAIAAGEPHNARPVHLETIHRALIGLLYGCYAWLQLVIRTRRSRQAIEGIPEAEPSTFMRWLNGGQCYALLVALFLIDILIFDRPWWVLPWATTVIVISLASMIVFWFGVPYMQEKKWRWRNGHGGEAHRANIGARISLTVTTLTLTAASVACGIKGWYAGQLLIASITVVALIASSIFSITSRLNEQWRSVANRNPAAEIEGTANGGAPDNQRRDQK